MKSMYEREYQKASVEDASMEVDYKDIMSIEIEENISINIRELSPNRNQLSSLSPTSRFESESDEEISDSDSYNNYLERHRQPSVVKKHDSMKVVKIGKLNLLACQGLIPEEDFDINDVYEDNDAEIKTKRGMSFKMSTSLLCKI